MSSVSVTVKFTATVVGGVAPYSYAWTFGDGSTGSGASPTHTYSSAGTFTVSVVVSDAVGETANASTKIDTTSPPSPGVITQIQVTSSATAAQTGQTITVSAKAVDQYGNPMAGVALYLWEAPLGGTYVDEGSATTDSTGVARWSVSFASQGSYDIVVSGSSASPTAPVPSNTVSVVVTSPPPPPQTTFQLVPGQKVKISWPNVTNLGVQLYPPVTNVGAAGYGLQWIYTDPSLTAFVGGGIKWRAVQTVDGVLAQLAGNDGDCYVTCTVDGNYLTLTFEDSLGNVLATVPNIRPGNQYDGYGKYWTWGGSVTAYLCDMDAYAAGLMANIPGGMGNFGGPAIQQPGFAQFKVVVATIALVLPQPVLSISSLGPDSTAVGNYYKVQVNYKDSLGNPLQAVSNPVSMGVAGDGGIPGTVSIVDGVGYVDVGVGSFGSTLTVFAFSGPIYADGTPYTANTVISNKITIG